ncbi:hypothetical protein M422DRAFT_26349 [Sphaerobolus stellatus SS14]|nr:hypothetical protein M422DRAFT_26349 [Sphaerobolus stellatus SS14]
MSSNSSSHPPGDPEAYRNMHATPGSIQETNNGRPRLSKLIMKFSTFSPPSPVSKVPDRIPSPMVDPNHPIKIMITPPGDRK